MLIEVDENVVLGPILRESKEFDLFYKKERRKLGLIWWFRDFNELGDVIAYANVLDHKIYYRKSPTSSEDAHIIAHEITHLVRYQENGDLEIKYPPIVFGLVFKLLSMLEDPIVDLILQKDYGFDLRISYLSAIDYCRKNVKEETTDDLNLLINGIDLANYMLRWSLIEDKNARDDWRKYLEWYKELRPISYKIAEEIVHIVWIHGGAHGAETIEKQKKVVAAIINLYPQLRNMISI
jgi:hypothetical protein